MGSRHGLAAVVVVLATVLGGCAGAPTAPTAAPAPPAAPPAAPSAAPSAAPAPSRVVDPASFAAAIDEPRRYTINVHVPFEGAIAGTDAAIPYDRVGSGAAGLPADRSTPLAIYCRTGPMSAAAAGELARLGYRDVVELGGGMQAWAASGRPLSATPVPG